MRTYDHLWQQEELADVQIVLVGPQQEGSSAGDGGTCKLAAFPGHGLLLCDSYFLKAQILRWQNKRQHDGAFGIFEQAADSATGRYDSSSISSGKAQLVLTLEEADQQPVALAVLQSLYQVKIGTGLFAELTHEQQLQAVLLADMWQVPDVGTAAAAALSAAADGQLSEAVTQKLLSMQAVPECVEPLYRRALLSVSGDLEAVWADEALQQQLLGLPLDAMALLLSCDGLKVASEDTVLYTVRRFTKNCTDTPALEQLMPLVRCPHLSPYWLSALAMSSIAVPAELLPHLRKLLAARSVKADYQVTALDLQKVFAGAPACWALPQRATQPVSSVQVTWEVPIDKLPAAAHRSVAGNSTVSLRSSCSTAPVDGMSYDINVECSPKEGGSCIGVFGRATNVPCDLFWSFDMTMRAPGLARTVSSRMGRGAGYGWRDFFDLPAMAGGWDETAWAAKGLPTSGTLPITLTVSAQPQQKAAAVANARRGRGRRR